jgi:hypothetical protein
MIFFNTTTPTLTHTPDWVSGDFKQADEIPLKGFQFHPPGGEPVWLTFRADGVLADPVYYIFKDDPVSPPDPKDKFWLSSVTQFAGMDAHIAMIRLLQYLSGKYFSEFEVLDESEYWETGDVVLCKMRFDEYGEAMDEMVVKLSQLHGQHGLSGDSVQKRLDELLRTRGLEDIVRALE